MTPVNSMNQSPSKAAVSCWSIMGLETSGTLSNASFAEVPVTNAGMASSEMKKKTARLARFSSSLLTTMAVTKRPSPTTMPTVGK